MLLNIVNKFMQAPQHLNLLMFVASFNTSLAHLVVAYFSAADLADYTLENPPHDVVYFLVMLLFLGNARSKIENPLQDGVYFLVMLLYFGNARSKIASPSSALK